MHGIRTRRGRDRSEHRAGSYGRGERRASTRRYSAPGRMFGNSDHEDTKGTKQRGQDEQDDGHFDSVHPVILSELPGVGYQFRTY